MLWIRTQFAAIRFYSIGVAMSAANARLSATHKTGKRKKPADSFGTLSSFGKKLIPVKLRSKQMGSISDDYQSEFENSQDEEEGWTSNFLRSKFKENNSALPVITEPVAFGRKNRLKQARKEKAEQEYQKLYGVDRSTAKVVIDCARKDYNHYENMKYPPGNIELHPSFSRDEAFSWDENIGFLDPVIISNVRECGFRMPTVIQRRSFRAFKSAAHLLITAETGSGKTVAYAAPLLSILKNTMDRLAKCIVFVPTHALRLQTSFMIENLAKNTGIKIIGGNEDCQKENLNNVEDWDVLVTTPGLSPKFCSTSAVDYVVLDEADMLLDDSFLDDMLSLLRVIKIKHSALDENVTDGARLIFSSATCPDKLREIATNIVNDRHLYCVKTENLHLIMPHVKQTFIRIREMDKLDKLKEMIQKGFSLSSGQTLIFCKNSESASFVSTSLSKFGIENAFLTGGHQVIHTIDNMRSGKTRIIVATDVASRGLDLPHLRHVVNYDFPRQISDYIHRCGRIGRVGSLHKCLITSFVRRAWEVKHVNTIEVSFFFCR
ncbi:unnamed protein product [Thelazia callipaeda]|uniref:RNA helicase n=1 Tax=Thelazia callipaeda TaxID=103827 RepID=A0A0N5CUK3_THECL|nr:unnamed protein product [Thelazia callipaeda]